MSVHSSLESLRLYLLGLNESFEFDDSFIAYRTKDNVVIKDRAEALNYLGSIKNEISNLVIEKEDSHYLMYYEIDEIKYISKIKENESIISIYESLYKGISQIHMYIEYDGSDFSGMQRLGNSERTVESEVEEALFKMLKRKVDIRYASRTDKGVHALRQSISFESDGISASKYMYSLNLILPKDIRVVESREVSELFDPRFDVVSKAYEYLICTDKESVFKNKYMLFHNINDINRIRNELNSIVGTHDFMSFEKGSKDDSVRTIFNIDVETNESMVKIRFDGNGFLHNMIRFIVGSVLKIDEDGVGSLKDILESKSKNMTPYLASASGLYLVDIKY